MFCYISPRTGNCAMVEDIRAGAKATGGIEVHWAGGGVWPTSKARLKGNVVDYDQLEKVSDDQFQSDLDEILASAPDDEVVAQAATTTADSTEDED